MQSNLDGVTDALDDDFNTLKIWRDANGNGVTDAGELKTLSEWDIVSIDLTPTSTTVTQGNQYAITATGSYTTTTGSGTFSDVIFRNNMHDTRWLGEVTITTEAAALPQIAGRGTVTGLREAMSLDGDVLAALETALPGMDTTNLDDLRTAMLPVLPVTFAASPAAFGEGGRPKFTRPKPQGSQHPDSQSNSFVRTANARMIANNNIFLKGQSYVAWF